MIVKERPVTCAVSLRWHTEHCLFGLDFEPKARYTKCSACGYTVQTPEKEIKPS